MALPENLPHRQRFADLVLPEAPRHRCVSSLHQQLEAVDPRQPELAQLAALEALGRWICDGPTPPPVPTESAPATRLGLLVRALEEVPEARACVRACVATVLRQTSGVSLFAKAGLPNDRGLLHESADRLSRRFLPRMPDHGSLAELLERIFRKPRHARWLAEVPLTTLHRLAVMLDHVWLPLRADLLDAVALLCTRVAALGLSDDIRERSDPCPLRASPFYLLTQASLDELPERTGACRAQLGVVLDKLEEFGVSVDVVYCLDTMGRCLDRLDAMRTVATGEGEATVAAARHLLANLIAARIADRSLRKLMRDNVRLLARKVIERAGETGEHYVTATRAQYWRMMASAAGGGVLTAGTCVVKFLTKGGHFPLFIDGVASAVNYGASFILMQLLGFTLATKQPSVTAAALAGTLGGARGQHDMDELVTMIARISRSQLAAAIGNIVMVIPAALLVNAFFVLRTGNNFLDAEEAAYVVASVHPFESGTVFFAALTGVLLWLSSLGAGWLENWFVYRRIPEAIEHHRAGRYLGRRQMAWLARFLQRNISGFGGNLTLGILLGMTPVLGIFFGLPLEVRHVTLSTGSLTLAACALDPALLLSSAFQAACLGIVVIGGQNFGVSFVLALAVAFRAREITQLERLRLVGAILRRIAVSPGEFFYPTRRAVARARPQDAHHSTAEPPAV